MRPTAPGLSGLNFYVAPRSWLGAFGKCSVQYRREMCWPTLMTGDFVVAWLPSVLVPFVGILGAAVAMALLFNVIEASD